MQEHWYANLVRSPIISNSMAFRVFLSVAWSKAPVVQEIKIVVRTRQFLTEKQGQPHLVALDTQGIRSQSSGQQWTLCVDSDASSHKKWTPKMLDMSSKR